MAPAVAETWPLGRNSSVVAAEIVTGALGLAIGTALPTLEYDVAGGTILDN